MDRPQDRPVDGIERGRASWYGKRFAGHRTACGARFDPTKLTIAHPTLPCGTQVRITNPANGRTVEATVLDRGPFTGGRIADLSLAAARALGMGGRGTMVVELEAVGSASTAASAPDGRTVRDGARQAAPR